MKKLLQRFVMIFIAIIAINHSLQAMNQEKIVQDAPFSMYQMPKKIAKGYTQAYTTAFSLTFIHELGHWIANKAILGRKGIIFVNPFQILPREGGLMTYKTPLSKFFEEYKKSNNFTQALKQFAQLNVFKPGIGYGLMCLAGPLFGVLGSLGFLKGSTIYTEYKRNGKLFGPAVDYGMKQPLFNKDQNLISQIIPSMAIIQNVMNLSPASTLDGEKALRGFNIKLGELTRAKITLAIASTNIGLAGLLGYLIYKANS